MSALFYHTPRYIFIFRALSCDVYYLWHIRAYIVGIDTIRLGLQLWKDIISDKSQKIVPQGIRINI